MRELVKQHKELDKVAKLYLASQLLRGLYFAWPIWYGFATLALNPVQVGLYFSVAYGSQLVAEVPTGAFADKYGRKRSALLGAAILVFLPLILYFGHNFAAYIIAAVLSGIGYAFISGSLEALLYDHKNISKETFRTISWLEVTFFQTGLIVSAACGGFLYDIYHGLPFMAESLAAVACFIVITLISETGIDTQTKSRETYLHYFKTGIMHLLATKYLKVMVLFGVVLAGTISICIDFMNEAQMIEYGLEPSTRGLLIAGAKVLGLLVINLILFKLLRFDRGRLIFMTVVGTAVFALMSFHSLPVFLLAYLVFNWLSATHGAFLKPMLQDNLPSSHRATAMSGFSALAGMTLIGGNALTGLLIQHFDTSRAVYAAFACTFVLIIVPCAIWLVRHLKNSADRLKESAAL